MRIYDLIILFLYYAGVGPSQVIFSYKFKENFRVYIRLKIV
uniref:Uncharacterized protein n=1 Tax=Anguilla anguilla TaxID=7936 RepID=A0A0E9SH64_ANGAN